MTAGGYRVRSSRGRRRLDGLKLAEAALAGVGLVVRSAELDRPRAILEVAATRKMILGFPQAGWEHQLITPYCPVRLGLCTAACGVFTIERPEQLHARGVAGYLLVDVRAGHVFHFHAGEIAQLDGDLGDSAGIRARRAYGKLVLSGLSTAHSEWFLPQRVHPPRREVAA